MPLAPDYYDDWREVLAELEAQTDRGVAIVGLALLDAKIEKALRLVFVPGLSKRELDDLFEGPVTPLGSTPNLRTHLKRAIISREVCHVDEKEIQCGIQA